MAACRALFSGVQAQDVGHDIVEILPREHEIWHRGMVRALEPHDKRPLVNAWRLGDGAKGRRDHRR